MPTEPPDRPSLLEQQRLLLASAGYRAIALKDRVKRIAYIFQANVAQYKSLVARLQDPAFSLPILGVQDSGAHDDLLSEAERLLHNVLTAMSTRIDQQRVFMKKHFSDDISFTREYRNKVESAFMGDSVATFLKELRNHITHHQLPVAQSRESLAVESFSVTFVLPSAPLIEWEWSSGTRRWITNYGESVPIIEVVDTYACKAGELDKWLFDSIGAKYAIEIREFDQAQDAYTKEYDRVFRF